MTHDIAFLHTSQTHVAALARLMSVEAPWLEARHDVAPALLAGARADGMIAALARARPT